MLELRTSILKNLGQCLLNKESVDVVDQITKKIKKISEAVGQVNLADLILDPQNRKSLIESFGEENFEFGIQIIANCTLNDYSRRSFTIVKPIKDKTSIEFIYRSIGGWKQFDILVSFYFPDEYPQSSYAIPHLSYDQPLILHYHAF